MKGTARLEVIAVGKTNKSLNTNKYSVILNHPAWEPSSKTPTGSLKHPRMSLDTRAAIFAPFAALSGYDEAVEETARTTDRKIDLSESQKEELNRRLSFLIDRMDEENDNGSLPEGIIRSGENPPTVKITYFKPDERKEGGAYITVSGKVVKIDMYQKMLFFADGRTVGLDTVVKFEGELFEDMW